AVFYFQVYSGMGSESSVFLLRAVWCVLLHGTWSFLTGVLFGLVESLVAPSKSDAACFAIFVACCIPAILLHGIYDACCLHLEMATWLLGGLCLSVGLLGVSLLLRGTTFRLKQWSDFVIVPDSFGSRSSLRVYEPEDDCVIGPDGKRWTRGGGFVYRP